MFAMIQNDILESTCLDLFAGSGSLGIEAISNGNQKTYFVDNNLECVSILKRNLKDIPDSNYQILNMDYLKQMKVILFS